MTPDNDLAKLIEDKSTSLQREMAAFRAEVKDRFDQIAVTQRRESSLLTADALAVGAMERTVMQHDEAIAELQERMRRLESK